MVLRSLWRLPAGAGARVQFPRRCFAAKAGAEDVPKMKVDELVNKYLPLAKPEAVSKWVQTLEDFAIFTAAEWKDLTDAQKAKIEEAGLPGAVINSLNKAVRDGFFFPPIDYGARTEFLKKFTDAREAGTIREFALQTTSEWAANREECNVLCNSYQKTGEWTFKFLIERWNTEPNDTAFLSNPDRHRIFVSERFEDDQGQSKKNVHWFYNRYPKTHNLVTLARLARRILPSLLANEAALNRVSACVHTTYGADDVEPDTITCAEFKKMAALIDPTLEQIWSHMEQKPMTRGRLRDAPSGRGDGLPPPP